MRLLRHERRVCKSATVLVTAVKKTDGSEPVKRHCHHQSPWRSHPRNLGCKPARRKDFPDG